MKISIPVIIFLLLSCKNSVVQPQDNPGIAARAENSDAIVNIGKIDHPSLEKAIQQVLSLYDKKNGKALDLMIHPKVGIYYMFSQGAANEWEHAYTTCIADSCDASGLPSWLKKQLRKHPVSTTGKLQTVKNPVIVNCDSFIGEDLFYEDTKEGQYLLSAIMKEHIKNVAHNESEYPKDYLSKLNKALKEVNTWEPNARRIVLAHQDKSFYGSSFIFYLTQIEGKWYLTAIDFASTDCSV